MSSSKFIHIVSIWTIIIVIIICIIIPLMTHLFSSKSLPPLPIDKFLLVSLLYRDITIQPPDFEPFDFVDVCQHFLHLLYEMYKISYSPYGRNIDQMVNIILEYNKQPYLPGLPLLQQLVTRIQNYENDPNKHVQCVVTDTNGILPAIAYHFHLENNYFDEMVGFICDIGVFDSIIAVATDTVTDKKTFISFQDICQIHKDLDKAIEEKKSLNTFILPQNTNYRQYQTSIDFALKIYQLKFPSPQYIVDEITQNMNHAMVWLLFQKYVLPRKNWLFWWARDEMISYLRRIKKFSVDINKLRKMTLQQIYTDFGENIASIIDIYLHAPRVYSKEWKNTIYTPEYLKRKREEEKKQLELEQKQKQKQKEQEEESSSSEDWKQVSE